MTDSIVPGPVASSRQRDAKIERDYRAYRDNVLGMLRSEFSGMPDPEELYQEAWAELLAMEAAGQHVQYRRAMLRKIAWRRASDRVRRNRLVPQDPDSQVFGALVDHDVPPDEQAQVRLDGATVRAIIESLDEQQSAVIKLRFDQQLSMPEIQERLGLSEKRLEVVVSSAYRAIAEQLEVDDAGQPRWARRGRSLLLACILGVASTRQRRRAQALLNTDPQSRAMLRAIHVGLDDVAAALPMPVLVQEDDRLRRAVDLPSRLDQWLSAGRHVIEKVTGRGLPESGAMEQAGVGGAGIGAGAAAVKVAALCVAGVGAASLCASTGVFGGPTVPAKTNPTHSTTTQAVVEPPRDHVPVVRLPARTRSVTRTRSKATASVRHKVSTPVSSPRSRPAASPAPTGSTEFGPGTLGSTSAPRTPAPAPEDGGGEFAP